MLPRRVALLTAVAVAACTTQTARRADTAAPATATLAGTPSSDPAAVTKTLEGIYARFATALMKGDTATLASTYTDDAILMADNAKIAKTHDEIAKTFGGMLAAMKVTSFAGHTHDVILANDYVIETGTYEMGIQPKKGPAGNDVGKYLTIWRKQADGSYKIARDIFNSDGPVK